MICKQQTNDHPMRKTQLPNFEIVNRIIILKNHFQN